MQSLRWSSVSLRRSAQICLSTAAVLVLAACSGDAQPPNGGPTSAASSTAGSSTSSPAAKPRVVVTPGADTTQINPVEPVSVRASVGKLTSVNLQDSAGTKVKGTLSEDGQKWSTTQPLNFDEFYTVTYTADNHGTKASATSSFSTVDAAHEADVHFNVQEDETYGLWQVVELNFSEPVTNKKAMEKNISVSGGGEQKGAFRWYSDTKVRYRPAQPWQPNSTVTVEAKILGKDLGNGMIGNEDQKVTFKTGQEQRAYVDNNTKTLVAYVNGKKTGEWPVTLGNPEWPSTVGKKVIMEQSESYKFDASSLSIAKDDPHYYETFYASNVSRLTRSGEFIHQALPSAIPVLGYQNVSHGCVGMPPEGAKYIHDNFRVGDMVEVVNTGYPQADPDDGYGDWNIPFAKYSDVSYHGNW